MQIDIIPVPESKFVPVNKPFSIMLDNKELGTVNEKADATSYKYHAILNSKFNINVYQGFGLTIDEALRDAIVTGRDRRQKELIELDELENIIWGDHELN
jgi:hypothetical protein